MDAFPAATPPVPVPAQSIILEAPADEERVSPLSVWSWALYDFANTIFSLNIITNYFPLYIATDLKLPDAVYAYPMSAAMLVVALIMPALGALSDRGGGRRMPWLIGTTLLSVVMTAIMGLSYDIFIIVVAVTLANIGYQTALLFYDALLPSVSNVRNWGKISGLGVGLGYVGALIGGYAVRPFMSSPSANHDAFIPTAVLFLLFSLPCFFFVRERRIPKDKDLPPEARPSMGASFTQTWRTLQETRKVPGLFRFLVANFFYSDALNTVIVAMSVYSVKVLHFESALDVLAPAIVAAVLGSFIFGYVTDGLTSKQSIIISLLMWMGVFVAAILVTDQTIFKWIIAPVAGIALGSTWTAARTMMIELSPRERLGEFLGIYNLTGKYSAVLGPALWGTTLILLDPNVYGRLAYQIAIATLLLMVVVGFVIHLGTPNVRRVRHSARRS
jgi:UMF1 family MFS transporter